MCIQSVVKSLSGHVKLRSAGITSGVKLKIQKESLASPVDILVSTPGRFLQHFEAGTTSSRFPLSSPGGACNSVRPHDRLLPPERVFLSELRYLVVDEGDTLFDKTFKEDIVSNRLPRFFRSPESELTPHATKQQEKMLGIVRKRIEKKGHRPPQTIVVTATVTADLSDAINTHFPVRPTTPFRNSGPGRPF